MTFAQAYRELECKFKARVDLDKHIHGIESVFLSNVEPTGQVDYVLVGMEPGLNAMDLKTAEKKIDEGTFENWGRYPQENTLGLIDNWTKPECGGRAETEYQEVQ